MPIFRSCHQADLLTYLFLQPGEEFTLSELAARMSVAQPTMHREVTRLVEAGLISSRQVGRARLIKANEEHPAAPALTSLLEVTFGPRVVIEEEFAVLNALAVIIFGSWAARYSGDRGGPPADVDVLVIGDVDRGEVHGAADRAQSRLGLPVNPVLRSEESWRTSNDPLRAEIMESAHITVLPEAALAARS